MIKLLVAMVVVHKLLQIIQVDIHLTKFIKENVTYDLTISRWISFY